MQKSTRLSILFLSLFFIFQTSAQSTLQSRLELTLTKAWERSAGIPGVGVAVITAEKDTVFASVGEGNVLNETPIDENSQFFVASISKTFTAALILRLQDAEMLDIDDLLKDHLVIEGISEEITIRHLLTHSSGIYDHFNATGFWSAAVQDPTKVWTNEEILAYSTSLNPSFAAGTDYLYCNTGYFILGMLAAEKTGKTTAQAMKEWVLDPLGLKRTFLDDFSTPTVKLPDLAENTRAYEYHKTLASTAGAMVSTPKEVAKFLEGVYTTDFLTEASKTEMLSPSANNAGYGLGTWFWTLENVPHYGHTGTLTGYKSIAFHIPSLDVTIAIHANGYASPGATWWSLVDDIFYLMLRESNGNCTEGCPKAKTPELLASAAYISDIKRVQWTENIEPYVMGYRLYYAPLNDPDNWKLIADEDRLKRESTQFTFRTGADFKEPSTEKEFLIKIVAVSQDFSESDPSDIHAVSMFNTKDKVLIVDGFDRWSGSWDKENHEFIADYMSLLSEQSNGEFDVYSSSNEQVSNGQIKLKDYKYVIWFLGDESTVAESFDATEQALVMDYLERGGNLLVSGAEVGWDLDEKGDDADRKFFNDYLKASFVDDGAEGYTPATGVEATLFEGLTLDFGAVYPEDYPDAIDATGDAEVILKYNEGKNAGVAYRGFFGSSLLEASLVYLAFPLESVADVNQKTAFVQALFKFFEGEEVLALNDGVIMDLTLYPNPAKNDFSIKGGGLSTITSIQILDLNGKVRAKVAPSQLDLGSNKLKVDVSNLAAGNYLVWVQNDQGQNSILKLIKKITLKQP